jgi:hypothetical protein
MGTRSAEGLLVAALLLTGFACSSELPAFANPPPVDAGQITRDGGEPDAAPSDEDGGGR